MALGRGLDALLGDTGLQTEGGAVTLPLTQIEPGVNQPRKHFEQEALDGLADSIRQYGVLQPLTVRRLASGRYQIIAGERRWRAAGMAGLSEVPVIIVEADDRKVMELALIENLQREDLNPMEEAAGYRTLIQEYGLTQEEAAKRVSRSRPAVANALRLLSLPQEVQWMVEQGSLSAGHGRALAGLEDPKEQMALAEEVVRRSLSVRQTEERIRQLRTADVPAAAETVRQADPLAAYLRDAGARLGERLGRRVSIAQGKKIGKLTLEFSGPEDLERLLRALESLGDERTGEEGTP